MKHPNLHHITVTGSGEAGDYNVTTTYCPHDAGKTTAYRAMWLCEECTDADEKLLYEAYEDGCDEEEVHGIIHEHNEGDWWVPDGKCGVCTYTNTLIEDELDPGTYAVTYEWVEGLGWYAGAADCIPIEAANG